MAALTERQKRSFNDDGFLVVQDAVDAELLARLRKDFDGWVAESAAHDAPFGETVDGIHEHLLFFC